ncbi:MAG: ATP synthase F0 subunit B [Deltaproteobacteria bacterium]|jgi:F-type H+-transporting ATPase subunit b|nr:ATP synthase F0 subunit B [Deltaproteobacteria bacterium]
MVSVNPDISLFIQILNFLVLMLVLNLFLFKPLRKILNERATLFEGYRQMADVAKKQLEDGEDEKNRRRSEALVEGAETMNNLRLVGQEREREILASAQEASARRLEESRARLTQESAQARIALAAEAKTLAVDLAGRLLGRQPL